MTHDEMIAVIAAHRDGKKIQCRCRLEYGGPHWQDCVDPEFNFSHNNYRINPEPREVVGWVHVDVFRADACTVFPWEQNPNCGDPSARVRVRLTEVLDD